MIPEHIPANKKTARIRNKAKACFGPMRPILLKINTDTTIAANNANGESAEIFAHLMAREFLDPISLMSNSSLIQLALGVTPAYPEAHRTGFFLNQP
jgi:hypothetical protein